jgi:hypothetical protein
VEWKPSWRIIPSRFPPIHLFERVADPEDWETLIEVESLTNPRLRQEAGDISLVPVEERISGPGASVIMAAFTHLNPAGSRFTDGTYGVFYTSPNLETAIAETKYHRERFMRQTNEEPIHLDMRVYLTDLDAELHDIRGQQAEHALVYHPENYAAAQHLARTLRTAGSNGIVYSSVRREDSECAAVFRPPVLSNCRQERHLSYVWDGTKIRDVYEKRALEE